MTAMATLTVPVPVLVDADAAINPTSATTERPIQVEVAPILVDGAALDGSVRPAIVGFETLRIRAGVAEIFDSAASLWAPDAADAKRPTAPLVYTVGKPRPWAGTLIAGSLEGLAASDEVFVRVVATLPGAAPASGVSPASSRIKFVPLRDRMRAGLILDPEKPESSTSIELVLRNANLTQVGVIRLSTTGGGCNAEIGNSSGAKVTLLPNGDIELQPGGSGAVRVKGTIVADHFVKRDLAGNGVELNAP